MHALAIDTIPYGTGLETRSRAYIVHIYLGATHSSFVSGLKVTVGFGRNGEKKVLYHASA